VELTTSRISLWDIERERLLHTIPIRDATVSTLALSPDASTLAVVARDSNYPTLCNITVSFYRTSDAVSPDATRLVIGSSPIEIWCADGVTRK
jgi:WD40 repeat protein